MGRRSLIGVFPATFSGESLGLRTLALKGSPESSNPSPLEKLRPREGPPLLRPGYSLGKLWVYQWIPNFREHWGSSRGLAMLN